MSTVETRHPEYLDRSDEWELMRHADRGQAAIHEAGDKYLPKPSGFNSQVDGGVEMYRAYLTRARFPDFVAPTLRGMVGLIHRQEAQIELPSALEGMWERATANGLPLEAFHRRITRQLLLMGRYSILTDVMDGQELPHMAGYSTEALINWSAEGDFFVLDETGPVRDGFVWRERKQFRELTLLDGKYVQNVFGFESEGEESKQILPTHRGGDGLDVVPLVVVTSQDLSTNVVEPPLIGMARAALAAYQLDADYRHQLYMAGQETLFVIGSEKDLPSYIGAGVCHGLPIGGDAKYVGPSGTGIAAHRQAIVDAKEEAIAAGVQLFDRQSGQESGEALRIRYSAQTASLTTVAQASAQALEAALRHAAVFMGQDPEKVIVKPNLRFVDTVMTPQDARLLMELWMGRAISKLTLFENLQRGEIVSPERSHEDEEELIDADVIDPLPNRTEEDAGGGE